MIKVDYNLAKIGGVLTDVTEAFNRGALWNIGRCIRSNMHDAGVLIAYE